MIGRGSKCRSVKRFIAVGVLAFLGGCAQMPLLNPSGPIGQGDKSVILISFGLMLLVVIPVFFMTFWFARKYRASNRNAAYKPKWSRSKKIEFGVWLGPILVVTALGILSWRSTHALSPFKPLASVQKPLRVDVIAMNWKWLFVYPQLHIATVNQLVFPAHVPLDFRITSQTVLSSFFIPALGSQIYAMPGMQTKLHLLADKTGSYTGRNYQFSGRGYSSMRFQVVATSMKKFQHWVAKVRGSSRMLDLAALRRLEKPSERNPITYYASVQPHLFGHVIEQFTMAQTKRSHVHPRHGA